MSRRNKIKTEVVRAPRKPLPISFRRSSADIATDELEYRAALDNLIAGTRNQRDVSELATATMYCARVRQALLDDPSIDGEQLEAMAPVLLAAAEAVDALDKRRRAAGYVKATDAERDALAAMLDLVGELDRVTTTRQQRDCMQRVYSDAAMARRDETKNTSKQ